MCLRSMVSNLDSLIESDSFQLSMAADVQCLRQKQVEYVFEPANPTGLQRVVCSMNFMISVSIFVEMLYVQPRCDSSVLQVVQSLCVLVPLRAVQFEADPCALVVELADH